MSLGAALRLAHYSTVQTMTSHHEVVDTALDYAATLGLRACAAKSVQQNGSDWLVLVEGMLVLRAPSTNDKDKETVARFLSEPFRVKIVVSRGSVLRHEWIGVQFS
jgi:hypothetical protein